MLTQTHLLQALLQVCQPLHCCCPDRFGSSPCFLANPGCLSLRHYGSLTVVWGVAVLWHRRSRDGQGCSCSAAKAMTTRTCMFSGSQHQPHNRQGYQVGLMCV
jgi:hypothetical protein